MNEQEKEQAIKFYLSKHISEVKDMNDMDQHRFYRGQHLYAERCKSLLKAALEAE